MVLVGTTPVHGMVEFSYDTFSDLAIAIGKPLLTAAIYLVVGWQVARLSRNWVERAMTRRSAGWNGTVLLARLVSIAIKITSVLFALIAVGASATGLLAVFGAFTVAIGLSLQDVFKNFFAGIYLLIERPFRVGDRIAIRDVVGEVQGIDIRTTLVKNLHSELVLIPNAVVFTEILRNDTHYGVRRLDLTITTTTRSVTEVERSIREHLEETPQVRHPIPVSRIVSSTPDGLTVSSALLIDNTDEAEMVVADKVVSALAGDTVEVTSS